MPSVGGYRRRSSPSDGLDAAVTGLRGGRIGERVRRGSRCRSAPRESSRSVRERQSVDGRFGRCGGCSGVFVFCGGCASVKARCGACARERRLALHRESNQEYGRTPGGRASGRRRQARFRAAREGAVTDAISTEESSGSTSSSPSSSTGEGARTEEVSADESSESKVERSIAVVRCAGCGRVLSGRVRPSERSPERHRGRRPRTPVLASGP